MRLQRPTTPIAFYSEAYTPLGDDGHMVQRRVEDKTFTYLEDDSDTVVLTVTVDAEMVAGEPTCTRMVIEAGTQPLNDKLFKQLSPRWFAIQVLLYTGMAPTELVNGGPNLSVALSGGDRRGYTPDPQGTANLLAGTPKRRSVTPTRLSDVADAYRKGHIKGVVADCNVSKSQAYRLVGQAREAKLLPKVDES